MSKSAWALMELRTCLHSHSSLSPELVQLLLRSSPFGALCLSPTCYYQGLRMSCKIERSVVPWHTAVRVAIDKLLAKDLVMSAGQLLRADTFT